MSIKSDLQEYRSSQGLSDTKNYIAKSTQRIAEVYGDPITFPGERIVKFGRCAGMAYVQTAKVKCTDQNCYSVRFEVPELNVINKPNQKSGFMAAPIGSLCV